MLCAEAGRSSAFIHSLWRRRRINVHRAVDTIRTRLARVPIDRPAWTRVPQQGGPTAVCNDECERPRRVQTHKRAPSACGSAHGRNHNRGGGQAIRTVWLQLWRAASMASPLQKRGSGTNQPICLCVAGRGAPHCMAISGPPPRITSYDTESMLKWQEGGGAFSTANIPNHMRQRAAELFRYGMLLGALPSGNGLLYASTTSRG